MDGAASRHLLLLDPTNLPAQYPRGCGLTAAPFLSLELPQMPRRDFRLSQSVNQLITAGLGNLQASISNVRLVNRMPARGALSLLAARSRVRNVGRGIRGDIQHVGGLVGSQHKQALPIGAEIHQVDRA
jgi:hypothetical protein